MKYYVLLLFIFLGCKNKGESIIGFYNSEGQTFFSNIASIFSKDYRIHKASGLKLQINSDSSFVEKRCKIIIKGKWNVYNDTLFLESRKFYFYEDSTDNSVVQKNNLIRSKNKLMKYEIKPTSLEKITINEKGKKILTKYIKTE